VKKYWPEFTYSLSIDTFTWSQMLLHYQPSYALEVLRERVQDNHHEHLVFDDIHGRAINLDEKQYHDALYDSFVSL
jgi:hypothetical protein